MSGYKAEHATDYTDSFGLAMAHIGNPLEVTQDGINFELLDNSDYPNPDVPASDNGCLIILDEKNLFLAGGYANGPDGNCCAGSPKAYIYNKDANGWRTVSNMAEPREQHSCGLVPSTSGDGYEVVVVGGGGDETARETKKSIEIFSIKTETWRPGMYQDSMAYFHKPCKLKNNLTFLGNDMSFGILYAYDVHVDDTFVMVGGLVYEGAGSGEYSNVLIKYLPESGTFMELPGKMKLPRAYTTAILVERSIFPPCT